MASNNQDPFDQDAGASEAPAQDAELSSQEQTALDESEYPELTPGQVKTLRSGKLPGELVLHATTLIISLIALVVAIAALAR